MRVKETLILNKPALMIYVTQEEHDTPEFQIEVDKYKKKFKNIAIFISGTHSIEDTLKNIIRMYS